MAAPEDIIAAAKAALTNQADLSVRAIARKTNGQPCGPLSPLAVKRDIYGSMVKATADLDGEQSDLNLAMLILRAKLTTSNKDIDYFNDSADHADILSLLT